MNNPRWSIPASDRSERCWCHISTLYRLILPYRRGDRNDQSPLPSKYFSCTEKTRYRSIFIDITIYTTVYLSILFDQEKLHILHPYSLLLQLRVWFHRSKTTPRLFSSVATFARYHRGVWYTDHEIHQHRPSPINISIVSHPISPTNKPTKQ